MTPTRLDEIEVRGERLDAVRRKFARATVYPWAIARTGFGVQEIKTD
jgi:hypothetical protein